MIVHTDFDPKIEIYPNLDFISYFKCVVTNLNPNPNFHLILFP